MPNIKASREYCGPHFRMYEGANRNYRSHGDIGDSQAGNLIAAPGERPWRRHTVHFRAAAGGRRGFLPAELFPTRPGRCGGRPHLLHQFRQDR